MKRARIALGISVVSLGILAACSAGTVTLVGDGGPEAGGGDDGGGQPPGCPTQQPAAGSICTTQGLECEYGADVRLDCNTIMTCDSAKGWTISNDPTRASGCPSPLNPASCPATRASVPDQQTCSTAAICHYPEGTCSCEVYCGSQYPVGHLCEAGTPMTWQCSTTNQGCPPTEPRLGAACTPVQGVCGYGNDCDSLAYSCHDGTWHSTITGCAVSSRRFKRGIHYLSEEELRSVADETLRTRVASYRYTIGAPDERLGFIIEDDPLSPAVVHDKDRVDLYGYTTMTVATLQMQNREIEKLRGEVQALRRELESARTCK
jgi:hypothetical protein